jgi:hypothetical protein
MAPPRPNEAPCFLTDLSGEHIVRGGKYERLVTNAKCAKTQIPDAPLPPPSQETRL